MSTIAPNDLIAQIEWRYATKRFDPEKKIPEATWKTLERASFWLLPVSVCNPSSSSSSPTPR